MKNIILKIMLALMTLNTYAGVIDLRNEGYTGRYCVGDTLSYNVDGEFVERILISAEGMRRDGFIKVYADGKLVQNLGVPGFDPDYSFRVRQNVSNITLKFEESCSRILDMQIFTDSSLRDSFQDTSYDFVSTSLGLDLESVVSVMSQESILSNDGLWNEFLKPLQVMALQYDAVAGVSDAGDVKSAFYALSIAKLIVEKKYDLLNRYNRGHIRKLLKIGEGILEAYDVKEKDLSKEIIELVSYL